MNWLKSRCSRDNFWNLMFWFGMIASAALSDAFGGFIPILACLSLISTVSLVPYLLAKANKVTYTEDKIFINKQGESLNNRYPTGLGWVLVITVPISVQLFFGVNNNFPAFKDSMTAYTAIGLLYPMLYFIFKNCPISILFNKNAWCPEITGMGGGAYHVSPSSSNQHGIFHSSHSSTSTTTAINNSYSTGFDRYPSSHSYPGKR